MRNPFKFFFKTKAQNEKPLRLNSELEISLSLIESGCIATSVSSETLFIIKSSSKTVESLRGSEKVSFRVECLKRPEFPIIVMLFYLEGKNNEVYQFDYSFGTESELDMELFRQLSGQTRFHIYFFDNQIRHSKTISLNDAEAKKFQSMID